jgi:hypothetical protein
VSPAGLFPWVYPEGPFSWVSPSGLFSWVSPEGPFSWVSPSGPFSRVSPEGPFSWVAACFLLRLAPPVSLGSSHNSAFHPSDCSSVSPRISASALRLLYCGYAPVGLSAAVVANGVPESLPLALDSLSPPPTRTPRIVLTSAEYSGCFAIRTLFYFHLLTAQDFFIVPTGHIQSQVPTGLGFSVLARDLRLQFSTDTWLELHLFIPLFSLLNSFSFSILILTKI